MEQLRIFDDFPKVDCNECEHYWTNSCDGTKKDETKVCNSFSATRHVVIPEQIKRLERHITALRRSIILIAVAMLIHLIF